MTSTTTTIATAEGLTERFDPTECLDERVRHHASAERPSQPGRYIEVCGLERTLVIELEEEITHIGRGLGAELHLDEASVSRRHAMLVPQPDGIRILDDRSSNGTFVNGRRIQQHVLRDGDQIAIGRVRLRFVEV